MERMTLMKQQTTLLEWHGIKQKIKKLMMVIKSVKIGQSSKK